jgi:hypothetical protein
VWVGRESTWEQDVEPLGPSMLRVRCRSLKMEHTIATRSTSKPRAPWHPTDFGTDDLLAPKAADQRTVRLTIAFPCGAVGVCAGGAFQLRLTRGDPQCHPCAPLPCTRGAQGTLTWPPSWSSNARAY